MLGLGGVGLGVDEHLELVELVHADDAAGVLAVRAGLAPVAGRPSRVALGAAVEVEDLVHVVAGEGNLARADEIEVFALEAVHLVGRSEEHTSELQSLMRISYAVFCLKKKNNNTDQ